MRIKLTALLFLLSAFRTNAQLVEISLSFGESCIDTSKQSIPIEITINNLSQKNYWIDLSAINYSLFEGNKIIEPTETTTIGFYTPKSFIKKNGYLLVEKSSKIKLNNFSSIFHNYHFEKGSEYRIQGEYKNPRNKVFKKIYRLVIITEYLQFSICY